MHLIDQRIENAHLISIFKQFFSDMPTNKTASTGDENM